MAMQLKTGADLNNMPLSQFVIENLSSDPKNNLKEGSKYYNSGSGTNSHRERIYSNGMWRSTAYMDDIENLQKQLDELDFAGSEEFQSLSGRVLTIEGLFNNGNAKNAEKLGDHLPSYYATADGLSALQQKVNAFLDGEVDSDSVLENLKEIQAFLDSYDGATSLADILNTKADWSDAIPENAFKAIGYGLKRDNWKYDGPALSFGNETNFAQLQINYSTNDLEFRRHTEDGFQQWRAFIHSGNYSRLITTLTNTLSVPSIKIGGVVLDVVDGNLRISGNAYATGELGSGKIAEEGGGGSTGGGYTAFDDTYSWDKYDSSMADWLLTAYHGNRFNDRINALENKATKVEVSNLLTSGTKIATIKVDSNSYDIFAPSTEWNAITGKPTTIAGYGITDATQWSARISDNSFKTIGYGYAAEGFWTSGPALSFGANATYYAQLQTEASGVNTVIKFRRHDSTGYRDWVTLLHSDNYSDLITTLNNQLLVPSLKIGSTVNYESPVLHVNGNMSIAASMEKKVSTGDGVSFLASDGTVLANICCGSTGGVGIFSKSDIVCFAHESSIGSGTVDKNVGFYISADGTNIYGDLGVTGYLAVEGTMSVSELLYTNGGVKIPSTKTLQIGDAIISYEDGALKVNTNFFAEGEVASGKAGEEGTGGNTPSGSGLEIKTFDIASTTENQMVECVHSLGTRNVVVQIFENSQSSNYQQVFADVYYVDNTRVKINFGSAQTIPHRVIIMG